MCHIHTKEKVLEDFSIIIKVPTIPFYKNNVIGIKKEKDDESYTQGNFCTMKYLHKKRSAQGKLQTMKHAATIMVLLFIGKYVRSLVKCTR